jgi:uncharacterized membrane protein
MGKTTSLLTGAILGAGAMYFFDPRMGNRRRALFQDQIRRLSRQTACGLDAGLRDLNNRTQGTLHNLGSYVHGGAQPGRGQRRGDGASRNRPSGWSPASRLLSTAGGALLMANCAVCRTMGAKVGGLVGFGLFAKAIDAGPGGIHVTKTMEIHAPVEKVFEFFSQPENYLRISDVVTDVKVFGDGRFSKDMAIAGIPVHFEERFVCCEPPHLIETRSEPASAVEYSKQLRFEESGHGRTRVHLHFTYHPLGGTIGHAVASAFGIDAKSVLSDLMMRAKFFLETGRSPHDAVARRRARMQQQQRHTGYGGARQKTEFATSSPQGPGAPASDAHRPGVRAFGGETPWPESKEGRPDMAGVPGGHFPPTIVD